MRLVFPLVVGVLTLAIAQRSGQSRAAACVGGAVIAVLGLAITALCASSFVDLPRADIWDAVPLIEQQETSGVSWRDLWAPHNEHRPAVARTLILAHVAWSRWNHWHELWLALIVTAVHVLVLVSTLRYARSTEPTRDWHGAASVVLVAGVATFVATATQWENFLLPGWQIALLLGACTTSVAFMLLAYGPPTWTRLAGAAASVFVGTAGFASCLLAWPLGALAIAIRRDARWRLRTAVWLGIGIVVGVAYVRGLVHPEGLPPPAPIFTSPVAALRVAYGLCLALGMPVWYVFSPFSEGARGATVILPLIGIAGIALAMWLVWLHVRRDGLRRPDVWLFPALLVAFAVAACGITAVGRVPLGLHAMTASRYIAFTALFWVGLVMLLTTASPCRTRAWRRASLVLAGLIVAAGLRGWADSLPQWERMHRDGILGRDALLRRDFAHTRDVFPVAPVLDERREVLSRLHLSIFRRGVH